MQLQHQMQQQHHLLAALQQQQVQTAPSHPPTPVSSPATHMKVPKPDTFSGKPSETIHSWIWGLNQYFDAVGTVDPFDRRRYAITLLRGRAQTWARSCSDDFPDWPTLSRALVDQFTVLSEEQHARNRLHLLRQTKSVSAFADEFRRLHILLPKLPESEMIDKFVRKLKNDVAKEVLTRNPKTLDEAMRIAETYDSMMWAMRDRRQPHRIPTAPSSPVPPVVPTIPDDPMELNTFTKLTPAQREHIIKNHGCLYCRELNVDHIARDCPKKKKQPSN